MIQDVNIKKMTKAEFSILFCHSSYFEVKRA